MSFLSYTAITSPLDQFEIRNFLSLDVSGFGLLHISLTNIGLYLTKVVLFVLTLYVLASCNKDILYLSRNVSLGLRLGYNIFGFFNQRFLIELFYNRYITGLVLKLGGQTTKVLDKGSVELLGPFGLEKGLITLSRNIGNVDTGVINSYALYIFIGFIFYILLPYLALTDNSLLLLLLISLFSIINTTSKIKTSNNINLNCKNFIVLFTLLVKYIKYNKFTEGLFKLIIGLIVKISYNIGTASVFNLDNLYKATLTPMALIELFFFSCFALSLTILLNKFNITKGNLIAFTISIILLTIRI
jgi:hypothetical protein